MENSPFGQFSVGLWAHRMLRSVRWEARSVAGRYPWPYLPLVRWRYRPGQFQIPLSADAELVIEGFLRSGTTYAFTAFEQAQPRKVRVAHHTHAPAQVIAGVRQGTPVLLLVREPEESVLSVVVRLPFLSISQALRAYARFHEPLLAIRSHLVVGTFAEATADMGALIRKVNDRFGTAFAPFESSPENARAVVELIDEGDRREFGAGLDFERAVGRPSPVRQQMKEALRAAYRSPALASLRRRAERAHAELTA